MRPSGSSFQCLPAIREIISARSKGISGCAQWKTRRSECAQVLHAIRLMLSLGEVWQSKRHGAMAVKMDACWLIGPAKIVAFSKSDVRSKYAQSHHNAAGV